MASKHTLDLKKATNRAVVRKHTGAIHIKNNISALERKIYNILLKNAFKEFRSTEEHEVSLINIMLDLGWEKSSTYPKHFLDSIRKLNATQVEWNIFSKDKKRKWGVTTLLSFVEISNGVVRYSYSEKLRSWLGNPNIYARLDLEHQKQIRSKYSMALWEYCNEQLDSAAKEEIQTNPISIEELVQLLGGKHTYNSYKDANRYMLKVAKKEVEEKTDLIVDIIAHKEGKRVAGVSFKIKRKKYLGMPYDEIDSLSVIEGGVQAEDLIGKGIQLGFTEEKVQEYLSTYTLDKLSWVFDTVLDRIKNGVSIKNVKGYVHKLLLDGEEKEINSKKVLDSLAQNEERKKKQRIAYIDSYIAKEKNLFKKAWLQVLKRGPLVYALDTTIKEDVIKLNVEKFNDSNDILVVI